MHRREAVRRYIRCSRFPHANHRVEQVGVGIATGVWVVALGGFACLAWCTLGIASLVTAFRRH